jgi:NADPH:quinone reductase-like Zn-dependent oxidoreductase
MSSVGIAATLLAKQRNMTVLSTTRSANKTATLAHVRVVGDLAADHPARDEDSTRRSAVVDRENAVREFTANVLSEKKALAPIATRRSARAARSMPASVPRLRLVDSSIRAWAQETPPRSRLKTTAFSRSCRMDEAGRATS